MSHSEIDFEYDWRNEVLNIYASEGAADIPFDLDNYDTLDEFIEAFEGCRTELGGGRCRCACE